MLAVCPRSIAAPTSARAAKPNNSPTAARTLPSIIHIGGVRNEAMISPTDTITVIRNTFL